MCALRSLDTGHLCSEALGIARYSGVPSELRREMYLHDLPLPTQGSHLVGPKPYQAVNHPAHHALLYVGLRLLPQLLPREGCAVAFALFWRANAPGRDLTYLTLLGGPVVVQSCQGSVGPAWLKLWQQASLSLGILAWPISCCWV